MFGSWVWVIFSFVLGAVVVALLLGRQLAQQREMLRRALMAQAVASEELTEAATERNRYKEKHETVLGIIRRVLGERDEWVVRYEQHAREHGLAQTLLMAERDGLVRQIQRLGLRPRTDKRVDAAVKVFAENHLGQPMQQTIQEVLASGPEIEKEAAATRELGEAQAPKLLSDGVA
jgi:hypothetical protein